MAAPPTAEGRLAVVEKDVLTMTITFRVVIAMGVVFWGFISWVIVSYLENIDAKIEAQYQLTIDVKRLELKHEQLEREFNMYRMPR